MLKLLTKTLGMMFYQQHAGLFLVVGYLLFGAVEGAQLISYHYALLVAICSSPLIWASLFIIWIVYAIKSFLFIKQKMASSNYAFVDELTKLTKQEQYRVWLKVYSVILMPILGYSIFILYVATQQQYIFSLFATLIGVLAILSVLTYLTVKHTNYNFNPVKNKISIIQISMNKPFWSWPLFYLFQEQPLMLIACKFTSLLAFKAILWVFADVGNDIRVFLTAMLAVVLSHTVLIFDLVKFDATYLPFVKSLRIRNIERLSYWLMLLMILVVPELVLLAWFIPFDMLKLFTAALFCASTLFSLLTMVYVLKANMERYMKYLLFFFFITMFAILAGYYLVFSIGLVLSSMLIFIGYCSKIDLKEIA